MKYPRYFLLLLLFLSTIEIAAQTVKQRYIDQKSIGGFLSTGLPFYELANGTSYQPIIVGLSYHLPLTKSNGPMNIAIDILPQFVLVPFETRLEYEYGLNIGFTFGFQLTPNTILSYTIGSGPHYISSNIQRQAPGFIFSDNMYITLRRNIRGLDVGVFSGMRHISNANLELPNSGVNNLLFGISVAKILNPTRK